MTFKNTLFCEALYQKSRIQTTIPRTINFVWSHFERIIEKLIQSSILQGLPFGRLKYGPSDVISLLLSYDIISKCILVY